MTPSEANSSADTVGQVEIEEDLVSDGVTMDGAPAYDRGRFTGTARPMVGGDPIPLDGKYLSVTARGADVGLEVRGPDVERQLSAPSHLIPS